MSICCKQSMTKKLKDKGHNTAIKPTMTYGAECWVVSRKEEERKLH